MNEITITSQKELDALPDKFDEYTEIKIKSDELIYISRNPENSRIILWGSSRAVLLGSSSAVLYGSSSAELRGSSSAELRGSSSADAFDWSYVNILSEFAQTTQHCDAIIRRKRKYPKPKRVETVKED